jgi:hypothetical protein
LGMTIKPCIHNWARSFVGFWIPIVRSAAIAPLPLCVIFVGVLGILCRLGGYRTVGGGMPCLYRLPRLRCDWGPFLNWPLLVRGAYPHRLMISAESDRALVTAACSSSWRAFGDILIVTMTVAMWAA